MRRAVCRVLWVATLTALVGCGREATSPAPAATPRRTDAPTTAPFQDRCEEPIIILEEEVEVTAEVPRGGDGLGEVADAFGIGGGAAGAYGSRYGGGTTTPHGAGPERAAPDPRAGADGFVTAEGDGALSTFAVDVDTASYALVRQHLLRGSRPDPASVRVEELVNYFPYDDAPPAADDPCPLALRAQVAAAPWAPARRLVRVALKAREVAVRPPSNLVFLIDVSGSMRAPNRLPLVKRALELLVRRLGEQDRVAIVVYAGASGLVLPSTSCADPGPVLRAIERLEAGGSTNGGAGLALAYRTAVDHFVPGGTNRVLLLTDGDWNVGPTSRADLEALIAEKARSGVLLTVLGFDMGGRADQTMERLANRGDGHYAYIDSEREARRVLVEQLHGTLVTVARDVKVQVAWDPARVARWRLVGYENRRLESRDFRDDKKDAGEVGAGHGVTALYEVEPRPGAGPLGTLRVRWKPPEGETAQETASPIADDRRGFDAAPADLRFATAVAAFGLRLRGDAPEGVTLARARGWAEDAQGDHPHGLRRELVDLIRRAEALFPPPSPSTSEAEPDRRASFALDGVSESQCMTIESPSAGAWLTRHQAPEGRWAPDAWGTRCKEDAPCTPSTGDARRDVHLTSTVLLAFFETGQTHRFGTRKATIMRGLRWLRARLGENGVFMGTAGQHPAWLDDHLQATLALGEAYGLSRDFTLKREVERATRATLALQAPDGGWSQGDPGPAGLLQTVRGVLALKAARTAGLDVPDGAFVRAQAWLERRTSPNDLARPTHDPARCAAALGGLARIYAGERRSTPGLREMGRVLALDVAPDDLCTAHASMGTSYQLGGAAWKAWERAVQGALLSRESSEGCEAGSWDPGPTCGPGGRVESTALALMTLQTCLRPRRGYVRAGEE
ncbi:MAG: von Willebrand factor type A domain-containing protein [Planctomycetes bacterium]|nr:von Willebrand factor type A domain-containing protein [Planctomycetota bacterium]